MMHQNIGQREALTAGSFAHHNSRRLMLLLGRITDKDLLEDLVIQPYMDAAAAYFKGSQFLQTQQVCEVILSIKQGHGAASELKIKAETRQHEEAAQRRREQEAREKQAKIEGSLKAARENIETANFDNAIRHCELILISDSGNKEAIDLKQRVEVLRQQLEEMQRLQEDKRRREEEHKREEEARKRAEAARKAAQERRRQQIQWALLIIVMIAFLGGAKIYTDIQKKNEKIETALAGGEKALASENFEGAQWECKTVLALNANNIRARELSMRVEQKKAETIAHLLSSAQSALSSKDHITALALCSQLLFIDSSNSAASEIKSKADDLKNADDLIKQKQQEAEGKGKKK